MKKNSAPNKEILSIGRPLSQIMTHAEGFDEKSQMRSPPALRVTKDFPGSLFKIDQNKGDVDDVEEGLSDDFEYSDEISESFEEIKKCSSRNETVKCISSGYGKQELTESTKFKGFFSNWTRCSPELRGSFCEVEERVSQTPGLKKFREENDFSYSLEKGEISQCQEKEFRKRAEKLAMIEKASMQEKFGKRFGLRKF